jgi:glycosyltransferase involved in cell wall biosynthesis
MRREEELWCPKVLLNVAVSQLDEQELRARIPQGAFTTIPNGVDTDFFQPMPSTDRLIVSAGGMTWFPNRDGLEFFVADILPRIRAQERDCPVRWVGRAGESERAEYRERHDVELTGYVDDIRPYIGAAACFVVPLRVGGGTRLKILDAWAMGKPVVSTSIGCEGLGAVDGDNILIRDDPGEFADAVLSVLRDASLRDRIGRRGRETAEREYSWNSIGGELIRTYRELL